jgi:nucleoid DNA-binding protein
MKEKISAGDIIDRLARRSGITKKLAAEVIRAIPEIIENALRSDGEARVRGLGTFRLKTVATKKGRNPLTGEEVVIPPHDKLVFLPEESFREQANEEFKFLGIKVLEEETVSGQQSAVSSQQSAVVSPELEVSSQQSAVSSPEPETRNPEPDEKTPELKTQNSKFKTNYWLIPVAIGVVILLSVVFYWRNFYPGQRSAVGSQQSAVGSQQSPVTSQQIPTTGTIGTIKTPGTQDSTLNTQHSTLNTPTPATRVGTHLYQLAREEYGNPFLWVLIYRANLDKISNPDQVVMGKDLVIPVLEGTPKKLTHNDSLAVSDGYRLVYEFYLEKGDSRAGEFKRVMEKFKPH